MEKDCGPKRLKMQTHFPPIFFFFEKNSKLKDGLTIPRHYRQVSLIPIPGRIRDLISKKREHMGETILGISRN